MSARAPLAGWFLVTIVSFLVLAGNSGCEDEWLEDFDLNRAIDRIVGAVEGYTCGGCVRGDRCCGRTVVVEEEYYEEWWD